MVGVFIIQNVHTTAQNDPFLLVTLYSLGAI